MVCYFRCCWYLCLRVFGASGVLCGISVLLFLGCFRLAGMFWFVVVWLIVAAWFLVVGVLICWVWWLCWLFVVLMCFLALGLVWVLLCCSAGLLRGFVV